MRTLTSAEADSKLKNLLRTQPWIETSLFNALTEGTKLILTGCVYSTAERTAVEAAARALPGLDLVENRITLIEEQQTLNIKPKY